MRPGTFLLLEDVGFALVLHAGVAQRIGGGPADNTFRHEFEVLTLNGQFEVFSDFSHVLYYEKSPADFARRQGKDHATEMAHQWADRLQALMAEEIADIEGNHFVLNSILQDLALAFQACVDVMALKWSIRPELNSENF